ncbi:unnamed protein product [Durusdinium trenchii]|uniref:VWFA domain-containing protein n=1 Tax=Durusdinium trenchii TaxID=1381693 RepID=A0ABP0PBM2_9DINO
MASSMESSVDSMVDFIQSQHGQLRQQQRRISSADLKAALQYGRRSETITPYGPNKGLLRLKFEYRGMTHITDIDGRQITCWAKGLALKRVETSQIHRETMTHWRDHRQFLKENPRSISNHTIFIIDQSGSMKMSDVPGARNRSVAVFTEILLNLMETIVKPQACGGHDAITIMDMRDSTTILLDKEPYDLLTYNKIIDLLQSIEHSQPKGQGNFIPAFEKAHAVVSSCLTHNSCNVNVVFLTDGRPSDQKRRLQFGLGDGLAQSTWVLEQVRSLVKAIARKLQDRGSFTFVAFGAASSGKRSLEFLQHLAEAAKLEGCPSKAIDSETSTAALGSVLTTISTLATAHCTSLTPGQSLYPKRLLAIDDGLPLGQQLERYKRPNSRDFDVLSKSNDGLSRIVYLKQRDEHGKRVKNQKPFLDPLADGLAILKRPFAQGAERFAFIAREVRHSSNQLACRFVGDWLVAKQSNRLEKGKPITGFHVMYTKLQTTAARWAKKFNTRLQFLEQHCPVCLPHVERW